jgi:uncharacterized protein YoxC
MLDSLLIALRDVSQALLPILGALALLFLCILLSKLGKMIDSLTDTVKGLDPTLKKVDESIAKVQAPLDTVVKYSHSLDKVHDKTAEAFGKAADLASESIDSLRTTVTEAVAELSGETAAPEAPAAEEDSSDE